VTDQGSLSLRLQSTSSPSMRTLWSVSTIASPHRTYCHCCGKPVSAFFRLSGIGRPIRR
jgi:hypothetical protein